MTTLAEVLDGVPCATALVDLAGKRAAVGEIVCTLLDALDGQKPTRAQRRIWRTLSAAPWPEGMPLLVLLVLGRRWGKTFAVAIVTAFEVLVRGAEHERYTLPGTQITYSVQAPQLFLTRDFIRAFLIVLEWFAPLGLPVPVVRDQAGNAEIVVEVPGRRCVHVVQVLAANATVGGRSLAVAFALWDEAGGMPSEPHLAQTDEDLLRALRPAMLQFPRARFILAGTPGIPQTVFHKWVEKETPKGALVACAPTWTNGRYTEARCRELADNDEATFEQEFAARRWGWAGQNFIDVGGLKVGSPYADQGPRAGSFVIALDASSGAGADAIAIGAYSAFDVEVSPGHAPVRNVVVEHSESIPPDRDNPPSIEFVVSRAVKLSRSYGDAPIVFDQWSASEVRRLLTERHGYFECEAPDVPGRRQFQQASMAPQHQTPRFRAVKALVLGSRLHLGRGHENLRGQIGKLKATQLTSGDLRVEGRKRDDEADCAALGVAIAMRLPPTPIKGGVEIVQVDDGVHFERARPGQYSVTLPTYARVHPNGDVEPCEIPEWSPAFPDYAADMVQRGQRTAAVERWEAEQRAHGGGVDAGVTIRVQH